VAGVMPGTLAPGAGRTVAIGIVQEASEGAARVRVADAVTSLAAQHDGAQRHLYRGVHERLDQRRTGAIAPAERAVAGRPLGLGPGGERAAGIGPAEDVALGEGRVG